MVLIHPVQHHLRLKRRRNMQYLSQRHSRIGTLGQLHNNLHSPSRPFLQIYLISEQIERTLYFIFGILVSYYLGAHVSRLDYHFTVHAFEAQAFGFLEELVLGQVQGFYLLHQVSVSQGFFWQVYGRTVEREYDVGQRVFCGGFFIGDQLYLILLLLLKLLHQLYILRVNLFFLLNSLLLLLFLLNFLAHLPLLFNLRLGQLKSRKPLPHNITLLHFHPILHKPSSNDAVPQITLEGMQVEGFHGTGQSIEHVLVVFTVFFQPFEQVFLDFVLVGEGALCFCVLFVLVALLFHCIYLVIFGLLQQQLLHNFLPLPLQHLQPNHISPCSTAPKPLHAKIISHAMIPETVNPFLNLGSIAGINHPQNKPKLIAPKIPHPNIIAHPLPKPVNPDLLILAGMPIEPPQSLHLRIVHRYHLASDPPLIFEPRSGEELLINARQLGQLEQGAHCVNV